MKKAYAFLGDYYHEAAPLWECLQKASAQQAEANELIRGDLNDLNAILDENPAAIIIGREDRLNPNDEKVDHWLTKELDEKLEAYVKNGGGLLVIHAGLASYPVESAFVNMARGYFLEHPAEHCQVRYQGEDFDYEVLDEHYFVHVEEAQTDVFLRSTSFHGEHAAGWRHGFGAGQVECLVPTHNNAGFEHPETIRLIANGYGNVLKKA